MEHGPAFRWTGREQCFESVLYSTEFRTDVYGDWRSLPYGVSVLEGVVRAWGTLEGGGGAWQEGNTGRWEVGGRTFIFGLFYILVVPCSH